MELQSSACSIVLNNACEIPNDILDDLCSRFIINVPEEERKELIRICFQIELAHWFYLDFYSKEIMKHKKSCAFKEFAYQIFKHIPDLEPYANDIERIIDEWKGYKFSVPTFGAILLDENMSHVLLVQSYCSKYSWGFPKGKINKDETPCHCAVREVYEETGFNIEHLLDPKEYIEVQVNEQMVRLYVVPGVSRGEIFAPKTRFEIKAVNWFPVTELPATKKDAALKLKSGATTHSFFLVTPFIRRLRQWIFEHDKKYIKKYKRPRFKSCGELDYYRYKYTPSSSNAKKDDFNYCVEYLSGLKSDDLSTVKKTFQELNILVNKSISLDSAVKNKTIKHNKNSSFVQVSSSSSSQLDNKLKNSQYRCDTFKTIPFKKLSLSKPFLENGILLFNDFKFNVSLILSDCSTGKTISLNEVYTL